MVYNVLYPEHIIPILCSKAFGHFSQNHVVATCRDCQALMAESFSGKNFYDYKKTVEFWKDCFLAYEHCLKNLLFCLLILKQKSDWRIEGEVYKIHQNACVFIKRLHSTHSKNIRWLLTLNNAKKLMS